MISHFPLGSCFLEQSWKYPVPPETSHQTLGGSANAVPKARVCQGPYNPLPSNGLRARPAFRRPPRVAGAATPGLGLRLPVPAIAAPPAHQMLPAQSDPAARPDSRRAHATGIPDFSDISARVRNFCGSSAEPYEKCGSRARGRGQGAGAKKPEMVKATVRMEMAADASRQNERSRRRPAPALPGKWRQALRDSTPAEVRGFSSIHPYSVCGLCASVLRFRRR